MTHCAALAGRCGRIGQRQIYAKAASQALAPLTHRLVVVPAERRPGGRRSPGSSTTWWYDAFIAHDLDGENAPLLQQRRLTVVLQHDLRHDLRCACQVIMQAQRALPGPIMARPSSVQVITPYNVPAALLPG